MATPIFGHMTDWEEICKLVSQVDVQLVNKFNKEFDELKTYFSMMDIKLSIYDLFIFFLYKADCPISELQEEQYKDRVLDLEETYSEIISAFKKETGVGVSADYNRDGVDNDWGSLDMVYFVLDFNKMLELTPLAKRLSERGVKYGFDSWVEYAE